jgi:hypothetical protein
MFNVQYTHHTKQVEHNLAASVKCPAIYLSELNDEYYVYKPAFHFILLCIRIVTHATLDLSNYVLQNYSTYTKPQNCNKHKVVIYIK